MASIFLRALSRGTKIYEWSVAGGVITGPSVAADLLALVDRIQFFDPSLPPESQDPRVEFSVYGGSLAAQNLPARIRFKTRCFLTPQDQNSFASVELRLIASGNDVLFSNVLIFGQSADVGPHYPIAIADVVNLRFTPTLGSLGVLSFATPNILSRLGITGLPKSPGGFLPVLVCAPRPSGMMFSLSLPLFDKQHVRSYGLDFTSGDPGIPQKPDGTSTIDFTQWDAPQEVGQANFWLLAFQLPSSLLLDLWNEKIVPPISDGLSQVRNGLPASFVPVLIADAGGMVQCNLRFTLADKGAGDRVTSSNCVLRDPDSKLTQGSLNIVNRTIELLNPLAGTATFPNLIRVDGTPLEAACVLGPPKSVDSTSLTPAVAGFNFAFTHKFTPHAPQPVVRMGALDLAFPLASQTADLGRDPGSIRASFRTVRATDGGGLPSQNDDVPSIYSRLDFLSISLAVTSLAIGGQDGVPGAEYAPPNQPYPRGHTGDGTALSARRAPSLQIARTGFDFPQTGDFFILDINETCYELSSQTLSLRIEQQRTSSTPNGGQQLDLIVIDPEPFLVARVVVPDYQASLRAALTDQIATWDNSAAEGGWQISAGTQAFQLVLPPQGLTEAMHKAKGLTDLEIGLPADFRLTPPAQFNLRATTATQRFVEVPWNLRRVLGYPFLPNSGAVLDSAQFELLYGLSALLKPPLNANPPGWMLSEIAARLGNLAAAPDDVISWQHDDEQERSYDSYVNFWAAIVPRLRTRLAVLEPWSTTQPNGLTLTDADGLVFTLRSDADLAYPAPISTPVPKGIPQGALKGSFAWAFESQRLYESIWGLPPVQNSTSSSAGLTGLHFSSLGGWGELTARYNQGKTSIIASVRMGRVHTLTIEQIGRIGNFWNKAKYVITYERTVAATAQFAGEQFPFPNNPILRKTAEYVQILEKKRSSTEADAIAGAYSACEFPEGDPPRIPVTSAWGENVGSDGYKIPLWRPGAKPVSVYTKPVVRLHLQGAVSADTVPAEMMDPEKLYFYTSVDPNLTSDTDTWKPVHSVDFGYVPQGSVGATSQTLQDKAKVSSNGKIGNYGVDEEPWTEPVLGAFTYHLKPSPLAANVVAGFTKPADKKTAVSPIGTTLRTITVMRGLTKDSLLPNDASFAPFVQSLAIPDQVSNILRPLISQVGSADFVAANAADRAKQWVDLAKKTVARAQGCVNAVNSFGNSVPATANKLCGILLQQFQGQLKVLEVQIRNEVAGAISHAYAFLMVPATTPPALAALRAGWTALCATAKSNLRFTRSQLQVCTRQLQMTADGVIQDIAGQLSKLDADLAGAGTDLGKAEASVQAAAVAADQSLAAAGAAISALLQPIAGGKIDKVRQTLATYTNQVTRDMQSALNALVQGAQAPAQAIATARGLVQGLARACATAGTQIDASLQSLSGAVNAFGATKLEGTLDSINTKLMSASDWNAFQAAANAELNAISAQLESTVDQHLKDLNNSVTAYANLACQQILQTVLTDALGLVKNILDPVAIGSFLNNLQSALPSGPQLQQGIEDYLHGLESATGQFLDAVRPQLTLPPIPSPTSLTDAGIALLRGFGDVPKVPQLDFGDVDFTAFRFAQLDPGQLLSQLPAVNLTPLAGFANDLANGIGNPLNLAVPTFTLLENLVPIDLQSFDLNSLFPHIAGFDLSNLFQSVKIPGGQYVNVTHGQDIQARSAWVQADAKVEFSEPTDVFSYFGVTLTLESAKFVAQTKISGTLGGSMTRTMRGSLEGSWSLTAGGYEIVILEDCTLTFDESGKFGFNIDPSKVQLQGVLEFLAEILSDFFSGDGFTTSVSAAGLQTVLDLPLPDIQSGSFGLANLHLMCSFGITFVPFAIRAGLSLASADNPFTLTVFILGGAGFVALDVMYTPDQNKIAARFSIGLFASASLAISLGPISGGVYAYFGIAVAYTASTGSAPDLQVTLALMFIGQVSLLGFVSVYLSLSLSGTYDGTTKTLIGNGTVRYSIKIGPFFSINVSTGVSYKYSNHAVATGARAPIDPQVYLDAANEYLGMYYN